MEFDAYVYGRLLPVKNREDIFGKQEICDCSDQICDHMENLLTSSTDISFSGLWNWSANVLTESCFPPI